MNYPFWDVGVSYGMLIAAIAVLHVFISHFAVGGGLYLVVAEQTARKRDDKPMLEYLHGLSRFFVLITLVLGGVTGVGIWFVIGLTSPAATDLLIHNFVWGWATEWTFFVIEIAAAIIYYYGWNRMSARAHLTVGWIYFGAAWMSLAIINGILAFMLTPGDWITTGNFWDGFFNPTYWSSTVFRTGICLVMASVFASLVASLKKPDDLRGRLVRYNTVWGLVGLVIMAASFYWYWISIPSEIMNAARETMRVPFGFVRDMYWLAGALGAVLVVFGLFMARRYHVTIAAVTMVIALLWFGAFEFFRESIRKPWIITDFMYSSGIEVSQMDRLQTDGLLQHVAFTTGDDGADLFRRACRSCHTIDGYQPLRPAFDGTDPEFIAGTIVGITALRGNMPPFAGTEDEAELIAAHIWEQVDQRPMAEVYGLSGVELGKQVYDVRCGRCHVIGGYADVSESLTGLEAEEYDGLLEIADDLGEEMPAFTGDDTEREALIEYLLTLEEGGAE